MGCFFGCFRVRDDRRGSIHLISQPIGSTSKDRVVPAARNPLSSLFLHEAEGRGRSLARDKKCGVEGSVGADIDLRELKAEAKFFKDCGTLPQTPAEIRNNARLKNSKSQTEDTDSSTFHSLLQNASTEKVKLEKEPRPQSTPAKLFEEREKGSDSTSHSPDSCVTGQNSGKLNSSSAEGGGVKQYLENADIHADLAQCRNKFRFDRDIDASSFSLNSSSSEVTCQEPKSSVCPSDYSVTKPSPYPTPLNLTDDMQTPGTVFPSYIHDVETKKNPRIRSKYLQPVLTPVENAAQLKKLVEESMSSDNYSAISEEHLEKEASTVGKELTVDTSLSAWLPPKQKGYQGQNNRSFIGRTPVDRPILGMVAAHWNADEIVEKSPPKWWDGNGIPNSTNKYKEDQKVSWHATPFEERLEKALSEDRLIAERKQLGMTSLRRVDLSEKEEHEPSSRFESGLILTV